MSNFSRKKDISDAEEGEIVDPSEGLSPISIKEREEPLIDNDETTFDKHSLHVRNVPIGAT